MRKRLSESIGALAGLRDVGVEREGDEEAGEHSGEDSGEVAEAVHVGIVCFVGGNLQDAQATSPAHATGAPALEQASLCKTVRRLEGQHGGQQENEAYMW